MSEVSLEPVISRYVRFGRQSSKGWFPVKCAVCNDRKVRGGFLFQGDTTTYHCFNCAHAATHDPHQYASISDNMQKVLDAFDIPQDEYAAVTFNALKLHNMEGKRNPSTVQVDVDTKLQKIEFPEYFTLLEHATDKWSQVAKAYLEIDRGIDPSTYPFYILDSVKQTKDVERKWRGRLIIPFFRNNTVIWYQGRDLRPITSMRYRNAETTSECILSNYDRILERTEQPLFVGEGFFDAEMVNGVAIFGNKFKEGQLKLLRRATRPIVYIPDTKGDGHIAANQALNEGWKVSIPDIGSAKDVNEACNRFGKLYVLKSLHENIKSGVHAEIAISILCKKSEHSSKRGKS